MQKNLYIIFFINSDIIFLMEYIFLIIYGDGEQYILMKYYEMKFVGVNEEVGFIIMGKINIL